MPAKFGAGQLIEQIVFSKREEVEDEYVILSVSGSSSSSIEPGSFKSAVRRR